MFRILGSRKTLCDGFTRREVLRAGTLSFLSLSDWFRLQAADVSPVARAVPAAPGSPLSGFGQAKSCILLFLFGSPSQHDTFDPKPEAPEEIRGELKPIATRVPGMHFCELFPRIARLSDRLTVVRSLNHTHPIHGVAYSLTATPIISERMQLDPRDARHWPFVGSVVQYVDERQKRKEPPVPRNICLPYLLSSRRGHPSRDAGPYGHFLGPKYDPVWTEFQGECTKLLDYYSREKYLDPFAGIRPDARLPLGAADTLAEDVTLGRLEHRQALLSRLDAACRSLDRPEALRNFDRHQQRAFALMTASRTREALDIAREPLAVREKYGMHLFGQATLAARRLVEAGSRFATVFWDDYHHPQSAWDTHNYHFPKMRNLLCPGLDQALAALLEDLESRGMLDETLVVCMSEHGRTPLIDNGPRIKGGGRGHWAQAYAGLLAGGGVARGKVVGKTDRIGGEVADTPISPKDILATIYHLLGIDPHTMLTDRLGRPVPAAGEGQVRRELLA
jgi:hypothetical protein